MIPKLVLNFVNPDPVPSGGFVVLYRPKGSLQSYFSFTQGTGTPIRITANILANVDYEGTIKSSCTTEISGERPFVTSNYTNATGNISIVGCAGMLYTTGVISILFNAVELLPLGVTLPLIPGESGAFVSNEKGVGNLVITHDLSAGRIKFTDSAAAVYTQNITGATITFSNVTIDSPVPFKIEIECGTY